MLALALATSLWAAAQGAGARADVSQAVLSPVVPVEGFADPLATDLVLIGVGTGLDLLSTDYYLNESNGRCIELNPRGQRVEGRAGLKWGAASIRGAAAYYLRRNRHKTAANVLRWLGVAVDGGVTAHNLACAWRK